MTFAQILLAAMIAAAAMAGLGAKMELPPSACGMARHIVVMS